MRIGLVGPSYQEWSFPFDAQRSINLYPTFDQEGKEVSSLYATPGLSLFTTVGDGPIRREFISANGRVFAVSGSALFEIDSAGTGTNLGTLNTSTGRVSMAENVTQTQLAICDGEDLYTLTYASDTFAEVTDPDLPSSVGYVINLDGYFIVSENDTGRFYISSLNDATAWDALDFATAESSADALIAPINAVGQLWLFGKQTTEIWTNTGASTFPFARISNAIMEVGLVARHTAIELDNSVFWLGQDNFGRGIVYRANGFTPQRVSTTPIEILISNATDIEDIVAWSYQEQGHLFYVLTGGGLETSLVFDLTTQLWHERAFLGPLGEYQQHLAATHIFAFDKHLVGDRRNGRIYEQSKDIYSDNGDEIVMDRIYTHIVDENRRLRYNSLEIGFETGVGLTTGQGSDPQVSLRLSKDGARTWSSWITKSIGKIGKYQTKVKFRRLGVAETMTFNLRITDPVKRAITGSYVF